MLIPAYQRLKRFCGLKKPSVLIGTPDSFLDKVPDKTQRVLESIASQFDGLAISVSDSDVSIRNFSGERWLNGGVLPSTFCPYEPVFISEAIQNRAILHEFETLLRSDPVESALEEFLVENYREVFGHKYDRIETQMWLRFPELDISNHNRRLDVFLRNSVLNDWELFEVKRSFDVSHTYRDVPVLVSEVARAIQQTKNYARILSQDRVKRHFAKQGIEYFEPRLSLVVGRTPGIPHDQWRWLRSSSEDSVSIITFDDLISELKTRLTERYSIIGNVHSQIIE